MRKFEVLSCVQEKQVPENKYGRSKEGTRYMYTVFHTVKAGEKNPINGEVWWPGAYGHEGIKEGDILEFDEQIPVQRRRIAKIEKNHQFREVTDQAKWAEGETVKKKRRGRPPKSAAA